MRLFNGRIGWALPMVGLLMLPALGGCDWIGYGLNGAPPMDPPKYTGFQDQTVGIIVWADTAITNDHPTIQADVARALQEKLKEASDSGSEFKHAKILPAEDILTFQDQHLETRYDSATTVALKLPVTRLVFVEIYDLTLHPDEAAELTRGIIRGNVQVIEVAHGQATQGYQKNDVNVTYPPKSPDGEPDLSEDLVYQKSIDAYATEIENQFVAHPPDPDANADAAMNPSTPN